MLGKKINAFQRKITWILSKSLLALYQTGSQGKKNIHTHTHTHSLWFSMPFTNDGIQFSHVLIQIPDR